MQALNICQHCHTPYQPERSQSALRLTYCGILCEQADLGFSIDGLIRAELQPAAPAVAEASAIIRSNVYSLLLN